MPTRAWISGSIHASGLIGASEVAISRLRPPRPGEVDRLVEPVVERTEDGNAPGADPVADREQVVLSVDVEREVLHGARR